MARDYMEDITPPTNHGRDRSIRNVTTPDRRRMDRPMYMGRESAAEDPSKKGFRRVAVWGVALASVVVLGGALVFALTQKTAIIVTPRTHTVVFDGQTVFTVHPISNTERADVVSYTVETRVLEESVAAEASGTERVEERASGRITVYNEYSDSSVRLIPNTRFETPEGLVYRTRSSVTVPGRSGSGDAIVPGSIAITVYADEPGERYNVGPVPRFTLPGLKSTPDMYESIYARSADPFAGGFVGERAVVSESAKTAAEAQLKTRLEERIRTEFTSTAATGTHVFPSLIHISYEELPASVLANGSVQVGMRAEAQAPVFQMYELAHFLASATSADAGEEDVTISDPTTISAQRVGDGPAEYGVDALDVVLSGKAQFVWVIDEEELRAGLAGTKRNAFQAIIDGYMGVEEATARFRPFWRRSFPDDPADITVKVLSPSEE